MFQVIVSGDEVAQAKPAPDMYVCRDDSTPDLLGWSQSSCLQFSCNKHHL